MDCDYYEPGIPVNSVWESWPRIDREAARGRGGQDSAGPARGDSLAPKLESSRPAAGCPAAVVYTHRLLDPRVLRFSRRPTLNLLLLPLELASGLLAVTWFLSWM